MIDGLLPHPELRPFIRAYVHNIIDFSSTEVNNFYFFPPTHKKYIMLYLDTSVSVVFENGKRERKKDLLVIGPQTKPVTLHFDKVHRFIAIELNSCGQYYILGGCPIHTLIDSHIEGNCIFGNKADELIEKLTENFCPQKIKSELDNFFLTIFRKNNLSSSRMDLLLNHIPMEKSISDISFSAGVSVRQFERLCKEKIGLSPMFYNKLRRFSNAYKLKEERPQLTWTTIAYQCGYFDQMHLIKDFRVFSGHRPGQINDILVKQYQKYTQYNFPE